MSVNTLKFWWSHELSLLKGNAIDSYSRWIEAHKPRWAAVFELMKDCKYKYKLFIKKQRLKVHTGISDSLSNHLATKNSKQFWKSFKSKLGNKKFQSYNIGNSNDLTIIANKFSEHFSKACSPNYPISFAKAEIFFFMVQFFV